MGHMLTLTKLDRKHLPPCHEDFKGGKVWQHWYLEDEVEARCNAEVVYEQKNKYTTRLVFEKPLELAGADVRNFPISEVSKEILQAVDVELESMCAKISEAASRNEDLMINYSFYDYSDLEELQEFRPILLKLIETFDFDQYALTVDWG